MMLFAKQIYLSHISYILSAAKCFLQYQMKNQSVGSKDVESLYETAHSCLNIRVGDDVISNPDCMMLKYIVGKINIRQST
jgi:hypothetical protein